MDNVYFTILDHCYLAKYMNLESRSIDGVISNLETVLTEVKTWKTADIDFIPKEGKTGKLQGFIFYTHNQKMADRVFTNGYHSTTTEEQN